MRRKCIPDNMQTFYQRQSRPTACGLVEISVTRKYRYSTYFTRVACVSKPKIATKFYMTVIEFN